MSKDDTVPSAPIRVMLCDDHRLLTDALSIALRTAVDIELVGTCDEPEAAVEMAATERPDVVVMDVSFEGQDLTGLQATRLLKERSPASCVVILTGQTDERTMVEAIEAGASGFLAKTDAVDGVIDAVRSAARGEALFDPLLLAAVLPRVAKARELEGDAQRRLATLTSRETEILGLIADGGRNEDIAAQLHVSTATVQSHLHAILRKLDVHSKLEAVVFAVRNGALEV